MAMWFCPKRLYGSWQYDGSLPNYFPTVPNDGEVDGCTLDFWLIDRAQAGKHQEPEHTLQLIASGPKVGHLEGFWSDKFAHCWLRQQKWPGESQATELLAPRPSVGESTLKQSGVLLGNIL